jgi:hypothetical protein
MGQYRHRQVARGDDDFLEQHDHGEPVDAHAAVSFANDARDQSELHELAHDRLHFLARHEFISVFLAEYRADFVVQKALETVDGRLLFFGSEYVSHVALLD